MYLETILVLSKKKAHVRSIDVSEEMGFSRPSVSRAMGLLKGDGLIKVDESGFITLTETGSMVANKIYDRHEVLSKALMLLGVDEKTATEDACKMEHDISDETFAAIKFHLNRYSNILKLQNGIEVKPAEQ